MLRSLLSDGPIAAEGQVRNCVPRECSRQEPSIQHETETGNPIAASQETSNKRQILRFFVLSVIAIQSHVHVLDVIPQV